VSTAVLTVAVLGLSVWTGIREVSGYRGEEAGTPVPTDRSDLGPWTVEWIRTDPGAANPETGSAAGTAAEGVLFLTSPGQTLPNYREARILASDPDGSGGDTLRVVDGLRPDLRRIEVSVPGGTAASTAGLRIEIDGWDGESYRASLDLQPGGGSTPELARGSMITGPPPIPGQIWAVIWAWVALTAAIIVAWLWFLLRKRGTGGRS
jgi:hypothetical protein